MYFIQHQCNTTTYFHTPTSQNRISKADEIYGFKRNFQKLIAIILIVYWISPLFGSNNTSWSQLTFLNCGIKNVHYTRLTITKNPWLVESNGTLEYFEEYEEIDEDLRKRIHIIFFAAIRVYRNVLYVVRSQKYFDSFDWEYKESHLPYYLKFCSFKIPSKYPYSIS